MQFALATALASSACHASSVSANPTKLPRECSTTRRESLEGATTNMESDRHHESSDEGPLECDRCARRCLALESFSMARGTLEGLRACLCSLGSSLGESTGGEPEKDASLSLSREDGGSPNSSSVETSAQDSSVFESS